MLGVTEIGTLLHMLEVIPGNGVNINGKQTEMSQQTAECSSLLRQGNTRPLVCYFGVLFLKKKKESSACGE